MYNSVVAVPWVQLPFNLYGPPPMPALAPVPAPPQPRMLRAPGARQVLKRPLYDTSSAEAPHERIVVPRVVAMPFVQLPFAPGAGIPPNVPERLTFPRYACTVPGCGRDFSKPGHRDQHVKTAHEGQRYTCTVPGCGRDFSDPSARNQHVKSAHKGQRYACTVPGCGRDFSQPGARNQHVKSAHKGER